MHRRSLPSGAWYLQGIVLATALLVISSGCGEDAELVKVDFSKKVHLENPSAAGADKTLTVAVAAMVSPDETFTYYRQLLNYLGQGLSMEVQLIQRKTYAEINELLGKGEIDLAFICSGPYVSARERYGFEALAVPQVRKKSVYRSYLIVNQNDTSNRIDDLRGKVFAFTDPDSNTGCIVPKYLLMQKGETAESFFGRTIYTYSHDNSILAVARELVDGAFVHEQIWEYYRQRNPFYTSQTKVIFKSEPYGNPPLVASAKVPGPLKEKIRGLLLKMHSDRQGAVILDELLIDRFVAIDERLYDPIRRMHAQIKQGEHSNAAASKP